MSARTDEGDVMDDLWEPVARVIARLSDLDADAVRPDLTLDELGIDSLVAAELLIEVEDEVGREFDPEVLFDLDPSATLGMLVARLDLEHPAPPATST
jgi:acyl carrier protein